MIYGDIFFIINFLMDFFVFWVVSKLTKKRRALRWLLLGAFVGSALYCAVIFTPILNRNFNIIGAEIIMSVSTFVAFRPYSFKDFFKILIFSHIAAFGIGGAGIAIFYLKDMSGIIGEGISLTAENFSVKLLFITTVLTYIIIKLGGGWINANIINKRNFCSVLISMDNKELEVTALIDSGNSLYDPISNLPVLVAEFTAIESFFPKEIRKVFYQKGEINPEDIVKMNLECGILKRLRLIPFASLGNESGMLLGFKPDKITIIKDSVPVKSKEGVIALYSRHLCSGKGYNALVNPDIFVTEEGE